MKWFETHEMDDHHQPQPKFRKWLSLPRCKGQHKRHLLTAGFDDFYDEHMILYWFLEVPYLRGRSRTNGRMPLHTISPCFILFQSTSSDPVNWLNQRIYTMLGCFEATLIISPIFKMSFERCSDFIRLKSFSENSEVIERISTYFTIQINWFCNLRPCQVRKSTSGKRNCTMSVCSNHQNDTPEVTNALHANRFKRCGGPPCSFRRCWMF